MRVSTSLVIVLSLASILIQNVSGAAVMSIDIGSEWMKVSRKINEFLMKHIRVSKTNSLLLLGWCSFAWNGNGNCFK